MNVHVKILYDEYGTREFVFFKAGEFSKPTMILTEMFAENLYVQLKEAIEKPIMKVRRVIK